MHLKTMKRIFALAAATVLAFGAQATDYYWIGGASGNWNDGTKWSLSADGEAAGAYPNNIDSDTATIDAAATITIPSEVNANTITLNQDVTFTGAGALRFYTMTGDGKVTMSGATFKTGAKGGSKTEKNTTVNNRIVVAANTENVINICAQYQHFYMNGGIEGSGSVRVDENDPLYYGYVIRGDAQSFSGTIVENETGSYNRGASQTGFGSVASVSPHASYTLYARDRSGNDYPFNFSDSQYAYIGALNGSVYLRKVKNYCSTFVIGSRNEDCSFGGQLGAAANYLRNIIKVGTAELEYTGTIYGYVSISNGTFRIGSTNSVPAYIAFNGGTLKQDAFDEDLDVSAKIKNSSEQIVFDDEGVDHTWATALDASNEKGLTKKGEGTLTLSATPAYTGTTTVEGGILMLPTKNLTLGGALCANGGKIGITEELSGGEETLLTWKTAGSSVTTADFAVEVVSPLSLALVDDGEAGTTSLVVQRSVLAFTWTGADDNRWENAKNWLVNGEATEYYPGANDTVVIALENQTIAITSSAEFGTFQTLSDTTAFTILFSNEGDTYTIPTDKVAADKFSVAEPFAASAVLSEGVYTAGARVSATYTWGGKDGAWNDAASWRIAGAATGVYPIMAKTYADEDGTVDSATFESSATVTLTENAKISTLTIANDIRVKFASDVAGTLRDLQVLEYGCGASSTMALAFVNLFPLQNQAAAKMLTVGGYVEIVDGTTNGIYATSWRIDSSNKPVSNLELTGNLIGAGALKVGSNNSQGRGYLYFKGDNSAFAGTILETHYSIDAVYWYNENTGSANATWNLSQQDNKSLKIYSDKGTTNKFGRLIANNVTLENNQGSILEIGALGGESTLDLASGTFDVIKVGSGNLTIDGVKTGSVRIEEGTVTMGSADATLASQNRAITFAGGALVNAYGTDVSPYIANSAETTAAIVIDDQGSNATWSVALPAAVKGGLVKKGTGTLSINKGQSINGALQVLGGKIGFNTEITGEAETLMTWDKGGAKEVTTADFAVDEPAAPLGLVIVTNETKVSLKVERTAQTYTYVGDDYGLWDSVANWKMGDDAATFVPDTNDTAIVSGGKKVVVVPEQKFGTVTLEDGAKLALQVTADGQTLALPTGLSESDVVACGPYTLSLAEGVFTSARVPSTFIWTNGSADGTWETLGNWTVNGTPTYTAMDKTDTALFPTAATVTLGDNHEVTNLTIQANVTIDGGENKHCIQQLNEVISENDAVLTLDNARLQSRDIWGDPATWTADIAIVGDCQFRAYTGNTGSDSSKLYYNGKLSGTGNLTCTECQNKHTSRAGVVLGGDNSAFCGTITMTAGNTGASGNSSRTPGFIGALQALSSNAVWTVTGNNNGQDQLTDIREFKGTSDNYTKLYFGALNGTWYAKVTNPGKSEENPYYNMYEEFVIGGANVDCTFNPIFSRAGAGGADRTDSYLAIRKVGTAELSIVGEDSGTSVYRYTVENGTLKLNGKYSISSEKNQLVFEGGDLKIGYYEASSNVVTVISEDPYVTETNVVNYIACVDPSASIVNSTGAISFDDQGTNHTWTAAIAASNVGGFTKKGAGTLTLPKAPKYAGATTVLEGKLVMPAGSTYTLGKQTRVEQVGDTLEFTRREPAGTMFFLK